MLSQPRLFILLVSVLLLHTPRAVCSAQTVSDSTTENVTPQRPNQTTDTTASTVPTIAKTRATAASWTLQTSTDIQWTTETETVPEGCYCDSASCQADACDLTSNTTCVHTVVQYWQLPEVEYRGCNKRTTGAAYKLTIWAVPRKGDDAKFIVVTSECVAVGCNAPNATKWQNFDFREDVCGLDELNLETPLTVEWNHDGQLQNISWTCDRCNATTFPVPTADMSLCQWINSTLLGKSWVVTEKQEREEPKSFLYVSAAMLTGAFLIGVILGLMGFLKAKGLKTKKKGVLKVPNAEVSVGAPAGV